jgi:hypothetical protein
MGNAVGASLAKGGKMRLYAGRRGGESTMLGEFVFPEKFQRDGSVVKFGAFPMTKALATGDVTWFSAVSADGKLVEGSVGKENADLLVADPRVYAGMELTLEGFECNLGVKNG